MKKTVLSIAALLLGFLAHSQEADDLGRHAEVTVIPRLDANPGYSSEDSEYGFDLGNSSLYTLFEGSFSEHFSWTIVNHWLQYDSEDCLWPYKYIGHSDSTGWLDYFKADFSAGGWTLTLGKDMISTGGFEYDEWDWDIYPVFSTPAAYGLSCYQWGGKAAYTTASGMSSFSAQMTASPFGEHPFSSGLWAYSAMWRGEYGALSNIWSVSAIEYEHHHYKYLVWLGQRVEFGTASLTLDWSNSYGSAEFCELAGGSTFAGTLQYGPSESLSLSAKASLVLSPDSDVIGDHWTAGGVAEFCPFRNLPGLRFHALLAYNSLISQTTLSAGVRWNINFRLF